MAVDGAVAHALSGSWNDVHMTVARFRVTFLSKQAGGRSSLANLDQGGYMPHFRLNDGTMLGVRFQHNPDGALSAGIPSTVSVEFMYEPDADYSALKTSSPVAIVEGATIVGFAEPL